MSLTLFNLFFERHVPLVSSLELLSDDGSRLWETVWKLTLKS